MCAGAGVKVATRNTGGGSRRARSYARTWKCEVCNRFVPLNYDGTLRWHTPNPKRKDPA